MLIREADENDIPSVLKLLNNMDDEEGLSLEDALSVWRKIASYPYYKVMVLEDGNEITGTFSLIILDNLGHNGLNPAIVENVIVSPEKRGKGFGKAMMKFAMEKAKSMGCYKLMLSSNKKRIDAHRFYDSLGFTRHGYSFMVEVNND
ncbi:MAG TPA: GNAT family N-acetyltransferase [Clostridia bacterium]